MLRMLTFTLLALAACSSDPDPSLGSTADASGVDVSSEDMSVDAETLPEADMSADADATADVALTGCPALTPAACMAEATCILNGGCVDVAGDDPFEFLQSDTWTGTAESSGEKSFPGGETAATLTLFRSSARDLRGLLILPDHQVRHTVWGGVGPTGELGVYLGPAQCADPVLCGEPFSAAYEASGAATDQTLEITNVTVNSAVIDFRTIVSLRLVPSDGFKPVFPVFTRTDPLVATWLGDILAVDDAGEVLSLHCEFEIEAGRDAMATRTFKTFSCTDTGSGLVAGAITSADASSLAHANGVGWFAVGPADNDLLFVGRVDVNGPWEGVIARRGDVWTNGDPIDPGDVPIESLRGTFKFYAFTTNP